MLIKNEKEKKTLPMQNVGEGGTGPGLVPVIIKA
jgi:hypothetical protein